MSESQYWELFGNTRQQIGKLFFTSKSTDRGGDFRIWILPEGVYLSKRESIHDIENAILVYGLIGCRDEFLEHYGSPPERRKHSGMSACWLHKGKWQDDFDKICEERRVAKKEEEGLEKIDTEKEDLRVQNLLSDYS